MTADAKPAVVGPVAPAGVPEYLLPYFADIAKGEGLADNYRIEYVPGAKPGDGFMSELLAITLVGPPRPLPNAEPPKDGIEPAELRVPLVCKMQPNSAVRKEQSNNALMFEREVFVYNRLFPMFNRLQRSLGLNEGNGGFFAMPKCYVAYMNVFNDEAFIIMQDLRHRGFEMLPKQKAVTFEHAKLLLQQLGRLHAMSFVLRDQRPDVFESFINIPDHYRHLIDSNSARSMFDSTFRRAERLLERPADRRLMAKLRAEWAPLMYAALDVKKMGKFAVFGHSDCWNNNMMFRTENGEPAEVCLLDWQFARPLSPADDFIMYLCSSTEKALRDQHYHEFLRIYYDSLAELVRKCGSDPDKLFSIDDFLGTLSVYGDYGVLEAALTVSLMVADSADSADIDQLAASAEASTDAAEETGHFVHLNARTQELYKQRLADVLEDARQYEWFSFDVEPEAADE